MKKINLKHLRSLNEEALRGLEFYKEELRILQERLEEIAKDNTHQEVLTGIEHFQNQRIIQRDNIDNLHHAIGAHIGAIAQQLKKTGQFVSDSADAAETSLYEEYLTLEKIINELRREFNLFAARWM